MGGGGRGGQGEQWKTSLRSFSLLLGSLEAAPLSPYVLSFTSSPKKPPGLSQAGLGPFGDSLPPFPLAWLSTTRAPSGQGLGMEQAPTSTRSATQASGSHLQEDLGLSHLPFFICPQPPFGDAQGHLAKLVPELPGGNRSGSVESRRRLRSLLRGFLGIGVFLLPQGLLGQGTITRHPGSRMGSRGLRDHSASKGVGSQCGPWTRAVQTLGWLSVWGKDRTDFLLPGHTSPL